MKQNAPETLTMVAGAFSVCGNFEENRKVPLSVTLKPLA
jgi:hypothetical protein